MKYPPVMIIRQAARSPLLRHRVAGIVGLAVLFLLLSLVLDDRREFLMPLFPCLIILASALARLVRIARGRGDGDLDQGIIGVSAPPRPESIQAPVRQHQPTRRNDVGMGLASQGSRCG